MMSLNYLIVLIQRQIFKIMQSISKKIEALSTNSPIHIYINDRSVFKIKDKYKQTLETMKLFGNTKNVIDKRKNSENVLISEVVQLVLVQ